MYEITLLNLKTNSSFTRVFYDVRLKDNFIRKCKYSKKVKIINIVNYEYLYN